MNSFRSRPRLCLVLLSFALALGACQKPAAAKRDTLWPVAVAHYAKEQPLLPEKVTTPSLRIDGGGLNEQWIIDLLRDRHLDMIEFSPVPSKQNPGSTRLAYQSYEQGTPGEWHYPIPPGHVAQLRWSHDGDPHCLTDEQLPLRIRHLIRSEPALPDSCLSIQISPTSSARIHLRHDPHSPLGAPFARWVLFDTISQTVIAALTTLDEANSPRRSVHFQGQRDTPYVALAALIDNRDAPRSPPHQR